MFTQIEPEKVTGTREQNVLVKKLRQHIDQEIHLKIEQDDSPITYILKEVGKDHIVVHFAQIERIIPLNRILFFQTEDSEVPHL